MRPHLLLCLACVLAASLDALAQPAAPIRLGSRPDTVVWGMLPANLPPVLRVKSGDAVEIDTLSHQGLMLKEDPATVFGRAGIPRDQVLADAGEVHRSVQRAKNASAHVLTGPIWIEGAEPGDMLEVRVIDIRHRVPYGANASNKGVGVLPDLLGEAAFRVIRFDLERKVALFAPGIEVPLAPFMGIMAVAPPKGEVENSRPPGRMGGNLDLKQLVRGSTLYLPVHHPGAQFFAGDSHAAQGDGEVNGTAIEASLTPTLQFVLHKGKGREMKWPRAETPTHFISLGVDIDLDLALRHATQEAVDFLMKEKGLDARSAYALASIAVDFRIAEAVNLRQVVYGMIPKQIFRSNPPYWHTP